MNQQVFSILFDIRRYAAKHHDEKCGYVKSTELYFTPGNDYEIINLSEYDIDNVIDVSIINTKFPVIQYPKVKYSYNVISKDLRLLWGNVSRNLDIPNNRIKIDFISIRHQREKILENILDNKNSYNERI